jgi:competence protein ComFC
MRVRGQTCPFCNKIAPKGRACAACQKKHSLKGVLSVGYFKDERLKEIIHVFKYQDLFSLKDYLAGELLELINKEGLVFDTISFVPLSKKRLIRRGYNQSQIIASELSRLTKADLYQDLVKIKETKTQVGLTRKERIKNLEGAFALKNERKLAGKRVVLIDDVITTGATLDQCASVLKKAGAREVWGLTVAKE